MGTFEYFAARGDVDAVRILADLCDRTALSARLCPSKDRYMALLENVTSRQAALIASWMHVGFIHGVMNTDNMAVSGETIDFGPCAFMDAFDPAAVFSSIDEQGRYAFGNQPHAAALESGAIRGNAAAAHRCRPAARDCSWRPRSIATFSSAFQDYWLDGMRRKLGMSTARGWRSAARRRFARGNASQSGRFHSELSADCATPPITRPAIKRCGGCSPRRATTMNGRSDGELGWRERP